MNSKDQQEQLRELQRTFNQLARTEKEHRKKYNDRRNALRRTIGKLTHNLSKPSPSQTRR